MKYYTYKENELEFIRHIKSERPKKIWWDFVHYAFDYGDYYFLLECVSEIADTQNESNEAIIAKFTKENNKYTPSEHTVLVCENKSITEIHIIRAFLYFTTFQSYSKVEKTGNKIKVKLKEIFTRKKDPVESLIAGSTGGCEEIVCNQNSKIAKKINPEYANLIDIGLLLEIEEKYIQAYLPNNGFGFHIWNDKYFVETDDLKDHVSTYEFIKIE